MPKFRSSPDRHRRIANVRAKAITHDARGNITAVGTQTYAYTSENMLIGASGGTTLHYDPLRLSLAAPPVALPTSAPTRVGK